MALVTSDTPSAVPPDDVPVPTLVNVVATFSLTTPDNSDLDLAALAARIPGMQLDNKIAAAVIRLLNPKTTCLLFSSGKVVCTGTKSIEQPSIVCNKLHRMIATALPNLGKSVAASRNNVLTVACGFHIDIAAIQAEQDGWWSHDGDKFPGLCYREVHRNPETGTMSPVTITIFNTGRCNITGVHTLAHGQDRWRNLYTNILVHYRDDGGCGSSNVYHVREGTRLAEFERNHVVDLLNGAGVLTAEEMHLVGHRDDLLSNALIGPAAAARRDAAAAVSVNNLTDGGNDNGSVFTVGEPLSKRRKMR